MNAKIPHGDPAKGYAAERLLCRLAEETFFTDWCYPNPMHPAGGEICDLLVRYDSSAIVWQIKNVGVDRETGTFKRSRFEKNIRQLLGARRQLAKAEGIRLKNPIRGEEPVDFREVNETHLVAVFWGGEEDYFEPYTEESGHFCHIFNQSATECLLSVLDTTSDFLEYLRTRESLFRRYPDARIAGDERDLLACFCQDRRLAEFPGEASELVIPAAWESFATGPLTEYRAKNHVSYAWDDIVCRVREGSQRYEMVARELARPNRMLRRMLAGAFMKLAREASANAPAAHYAHSIAQMHGWDTTYYFLFHKTECREERRKFLLAGCFCARDIHRTNKKTLGIATEWPVKGDPLCSYDFYLLPEWGRDNEKPALEIREKMKIFKNLHVERWSDSEF